MDPGLIWPGSLRSLPSLGAEFFLLDSEAPPAPMLAPPHLFSLEECSPLDAQCLV